MWAKQLELSGPAVLSNILTGKRDPGEDVQLKLASHFRFSSKEELYFFDLIRLQKVSHDPRLAVALMEKLGRVHPSGSFQVLNDQAFRSMSKWYYYAVREMVDLPYFQEDADWIVKQLRFEVKPSEIKKALQDLEELKLIVRTESGRLKCAERVFKTTEDVSIEGLKRFHESMIDQARASIRTQSVEMRDISGRTFNMDPSKIPVLKQMLREFRDQVDDLLSESSESSVTVQFNMQFFQLTQPQPSVKGEVQ